MIFYATTALLCLLLASPTYSQAQEEEANLRGTRRTLAAGGRVIEGDYNVCFEQDVTDVRGLAWAMTKKVGGPSQVFDTIKCFSVKGISKAMSREMANTPGVRRVEADQLVSIKAKGGNGGGGKGGGGDTTPTNPGPSSQETPWGIDRVGGSVDYTGSNVAWVVDSGIDLDHEDLNVDASRGFSAFKGKESRFDDGNGHGTHVAGIIAAKNNDVGVIGVAAGATVVPVKVLDSNGEGTYSGVLAGIDHVSANGIPGDVANLSLTGGFSQILNEAVMTAAAKGIKFTLAAGNDGGSAENVSPASANGDNIYTISAMNSDDSFAYFSNYGNPPVDYCAPGVSIQSTWKDGTYTSRSGTSMAAPHAAGVLLLGPAQAVDTVNNDKDTTPDLIIIHS